MDFEEFIINLMVDITEAANDGLDFNLHLDHQKVKEVAQAYENVEWFEIY